MMEDVLLAFLVFVAVCFVVFLYLKWSWEFNEEFPGTSKMVVAFTFALYLTVVFAFVAFTIWSITLLANVVTDAVIGNPFDLLDADIAVTSWTIVCIITLVPNWSGFENNK